MNAIDKLTNANAVCSLSQPFDYLWQCDAFNGIVKTVQFFPVGFSICKRKRHYQSIEIAGATMTIILCSFRNPFECSFSNQNGFEHILINLLNLKYCFFFFFFVKQRRSSCAFHFSFDPKKSNSKKNALKKNLFFLSKKLQQKLSTRQINKFDYSL